MAPLLIDLGRHWANLLPFNFSDAGATTYSLTTLPVVSAVLSAYTHIICR